MVISIFFIFDRTVLIKAFSVSATRGRFWRRENRLKNVVKINNQKFPSEGLPDFSIKHKIASNGFLG
jgi:hypothetical protein